MIRPASPRYFEPDTEAPLPFSVTVRHRVQFGEVDLMGIAWHGRYATFFEEASTELRRQVGLSYAALHKARLRAPIVRFHVDYVKPLLLDECIAIEARMIWNEAARLDIEYVVTKPDDTVAATGYTVQLFTDAHTGDLLFASPDLLRHCRRQWREGQVAP